VFERCKDTATAPAREERGGAACRRARTVATPARRHGGQCPPYGN